MRYHWRIPHDWENFFNSISFFLKKSIHIYQISGGKKKKHFKTQLMSKKCTICTLRRQLKSSHVSLWTGNIHRQKD